MNRATLTQGLSDRYQRAFQNGYDGAQQHWRKALLLLWLLVVGVCAWEFVGGQSGLLARRDMMARTQQMEMRNRELERAAEELGEQVQRLATDDFIAEKTIREYMSMARPGEIVYYFNETSATGSRLPRTFDDVHVAPLPPQKEEERAGGAGH